MALAEEAQAGEGVDRDLVHVLEENVGPVRCAVRLRPGQATFAEFDLPRKSQRLPAQIETAALADALSLPASAIGFENHVSALWSAGVPFIAVPIKDLAAIGAIEFDPARWEQLAPMADGRLASAYLYCRGGVHHAARFHVRMFAPAMGLGEDPATGAALAAFSGAIHAFDQPVDGHHALLVEQGVEMGRPPISTCISISPAARSTRPASVDRRSASPPARSISSRSTGFRGLAKKIARGRWTTPKKAFIRPVKTAAQPRFWTGD